MRWCRVECFFSVQRFRRVFISGSELCRSSSCFQVLRRQSLGANANRWSFNSVSLPGLPPWPNLKWTGGQRVGQRIADGSAWKRRRFPLRPVSDTPLADDPTGLFRPHWRSANSLLRSIWFYGPYGPIPSPFPLYQGHRCHGTHQSRVTRMAPLTSSTCTLDGSRLPKRLPSGQGSDMPENRSL